MPVSKAQQKAVHKYVKANYDRMELTVPKGRKEEIKKYAAENKESVNGFINRAISEAIARDGAEKPAGASRASPAIPVPPAQQNAAQGVSAAVLPSEQMEQVRVHIAKTGEDTAAFLERAVAEQLNRDSMAFKLGINPAKKGGATSD